MLLKKLTLSREDWLGALPPRRVGAIGFYLFSLGVHARLAV
jgi:hypothetical protein